MEGESRRLRFWFLGIGVLITPPAAFLAVVSSGAGHGSYIFAIVFFPHILLLSAALGEMGWLLLLLALVQFPLYGLLLDWAAYRKRLRTVGAILLAVHVVAAAFPFLL